MALRKSAFEAQVSAQDMLAFYRQMLLIRRFEEKAGQLYSMGQIGGFCHLYIGQEAVVVGLEASSREGDTRIASYRAHGHMLACGMDPDRIMAEMTGRASGYSKGKGGSMHMASPENGFYGGHGILGAQVPIGAGLAFAQKYRGDGAITFVSFGDGACAQGQVHETLNIAARLKLPIVFVIENNAHGVDLPRRKAPPALHTRAAPFGIASEIVDGMDVLAVHAAAMKAARHCRTGKGPYLLEATTYRYRGHSMSDPARYRSREEMHKMREERDPIERLRALLIEGKHASDDALKGIDKEVKARISQVADFARESTEPPLAALTTDVYAPVEV